jgi:hypothetical protein
MHVPSPPRSTEFMDEGLENYPPILGGDIIIPLAALDARKKRKTGPALATACTRQEWSVGVGGVVLIEICSRESSLMRSRLG